MSDEDELLLRRRREEDKTLVESSCLNYFHSISITNRRRSNGQNSVCGSSESRTISISPRAFPVSQVKPIITLKETIPALDMASLAMAFAPATRIVFAATEAKSTGPSKPEKGPLDWILGGLQKEQLVETDPILKKVEEKNGKKNSVAVPQKKKEGFGGLFAKN